MFTHLKKDYYSVNANISISPVKQQIAMLTGDENALQEMMMLPERTMMSENGFVADGTQS